MKDKRTYPELCEFINKSLLVFLSEFVSFYSLHICLSNIINNKYRILAIEMGKDKEGIQFESNGQSDLLESSTDVA